MCLKENFTDHSSALKDSMMKFGQLLAISGTVTGVAAHGYLTIPSSRTRLGFEVGHVPYYHQRQESHVVNIVLSCHRPELTHVPNARSLSLLNHGPTWRLLRWAAVDHVATTPESA